MLEVSFDVMQSAALAALVAMVGRGIVKRVKFFQTYCIPGVIVAGLIVSFILGILRSAGLLSVHFEVTVLKEWFMDIFFTGVGLTASWALIKKGGKVCIGITITTIGLILGQDILGVALAVLLGMHPLHGLGLGSLSLMGGVGTSSAIAPSYEALGGVDAIIFTAGVGENSASQRMAIASGLEFMGVKMDEDANKVRGEERVITAPDSKVTVLLIPTNEELMIAMDTEALVG